MPCGEKASTFPGWLFFVHTKMTKKNQKPAAASSRGSRDSRRKATRPQPRGGAQWKVTPYTLEAAHWNVLCVDGSAPAHPGEVITPNGGPVAGRTYRALAMVESEEGGGIVILGLPCIDIEDGERLGCNAKRFRVVSRT